MSYVYDLHTHTTASDGKYTPEELIKQARLTGIDVLAITDHDTTSGLERAYQSTVSHSIQLIPGLELSVTWNNKNFHIVGLNIDPGNKALRSGLQEHLQLRELRAIKIGQRLGKYGIPVAYEGAKQLAKDEAITRNHFARYLVKEGYAKDINAVFKKYLVRNKPGFVKTYWVDMQTGIDLIKQAGGIAILAHPLRYHLTGSRMRNLLSAFKQGRGDGIEIVTGNCTQDDIYTSAAYARRFDLAGSVGSDFHGHETNGVQLGKLKNMPEDIIPVWNAW